MAGRLSRCNMLSYNCAVFFIVNVYDQVRLDQPITMQLHEASVRWIDSQWTQSHGKKCQNVVNRRFDVEKAIDKQL